MRSITLFLFLLPFHVKASPHPAKLATLSAQDETLQKDLILILKKTIFGENKITFKTFPAPSSKVLVSCQNQKIHMDVYSPPEEKASTFYKGLRELGFLFPHPRLQLSPTEKDMKRSCGKSIAWRPALKWRGSHLHTLHPNEWVDAFFLGKTDVAYDTVRWHARNQLNLLDLSLLRVPLSDLKKNIRPPYELAQGFGIHTGVSLGIALQQQKSYKLLTVLQSFTGWGADESIEKGLNELAEALPLSFVVLEAGTSEFTPTNYEKTLSWLNLSQKVLAQKKIALFTKVHVSSNQTSEKWGNYNFLPQYADAGVGILPHTVMFYGLLDKRAPVYGNENFDAIRNFSLKEKDKRPTWYYPETSYWVGMDIDIPLFLTDYLRTRAEDTKWLFDQGFEGQLNFTSGHVLGGWLFDWNLALLNDLDNKFSPTAGLELLKEPVELWEKHLSFQAKWFKEEGLLASLSTANLQDELSSSHRIHRRTILKELAKDPELLEREIKTLTQALGEWPRTQEILHPELKAMLQVTKLRHRHALKIREALKDDKDRHLSEATKVREEAKGILTGLKKFETSYPELPLFELSENPTSYQFGYVYPAGELYFWEREEGQVREDSYFPFKKNLYDLFGILF